jgi:hypothetical protein
LDGIRLEQLTVMVKENGDQTELGQPRQEEERSDDEKK